MASGPKQHGVWDWSNNKFHSIQIRVAPVDKSVVCTHL